MGAMESPARMVMTPWKLRSVLSARARRIMFLRTFRRFLSLGSARIELATQRETLVEKLIILRRFAEADSAASGLFQACPARSESLMRRKSSESMEVSCSARSVMLKFCRESSPGNLT